MIETQQRVLKILRRTTWSESSTKPTLKAKRDLQTLETLRDQGQQRFLEAEHRLEVVSRERVASKRRKTRIGQIL
ncbi:MAG: hypothetical protein KJ000_20305 [Pirellulaceae bacterium]|nr:hypothetical protein [Pirellulaceae bacterium]